MLKRKNDRQPPQSLDELYPDDYWLDEEDGEEELPDPAMKRKPVSGRLHDEPMVTGYEALERQRGVRRPNRKLTRREKKALKRAQKYEEKLHKEHEKADKKLRCLQIFAKLSLILLKVWVYVIMVVFRIHIDFLHLKCK